MNSFLIPKSGVTNINRTGLVLQIITHYDQLSFINIIITTHSDHVLY